MSEAEYIRKGQTRKRAPPRPRIRPLKVRLSSTRVWLSLRDGTAEPGQWERHLVENQPSSRRPPWAVPVKLMGKLAGVTAGLRATVECR